MSVINHPNLLYFAENSLCLTSWLVSQSAPLQALIRSGVTTGPPVAGGVEPEVSPVRLETVSESAVSCFANFHSVSSVQPSTSSVTVKLSSAEKY